MPLSLQLYEGNRADVATHRPNWEALRELLEKEDFIYVADSKLCARASLSHIAERGGRFITVMPRNFKEVSQFLQRLGEGEDIEWQHSCQKPNSRKKTELITYRIHEGESARDGYRLLWVHRGSKAAQEEKARERRLEQAEETLSKLAAKLNTYHIKRREPIEAAVEFLGTYKQQPYLEKRFPTTKSVLEVAPVFLKTPRRIEAMVFLYFIALMLVSLLERTIRGQMHQEHIESLPICSSGLSTKAPTWENLQHVFRNVHLTMVVQGQRILTMTVKGISALHAHLLRLLKVPILVYEQLKDGWWSFALHGG